MSNRKRSASLVALLVGLTATMGTGAAVADTQMAAVTTTDGTAVGVGDLVGTGVRSGDTCTFPEPSGVVVHTAAAVTLDIDSSCQVVVQAIEFVTSAGSGAAPIGHARQQKRPGAVPDALPFVVGSTSIYGVVAEIAGKEVPSPDSLKLYTGTVVQTFYNTAGQFQWQDAIALDYTKNTRTGEIVASAPAEIGNYCDVYLLDPTTTYSNEVTSCIRQHTAGGGSYTELEGSGNYRQLLLGQELAKATAKEVLIITKTNASGYCPLPGALPALWTSRCEVETGQED